MNVYAEILFVIIRAILVTGGTFAVRHGWIAQATAAHFSTPAAVWLAAGLVVIFGALASAALAEARKSATAWLALRFPAGTPAGHVVAALEQLAGRSFWTLAKRLQEEVSGAEAAHVADAIATVQKVTQGTIGQGVQAAVIDAIRADPSLVQPTTTKGDANG